MSQRQALKLKLSTSGAPKPPAQNPPTPPTPATSTPKLKLKLGSSSSQIPAPQLEAPPAALAPNGRPKAVRKSNPTPKKRALEAESEDEQDGSALRPASGPVKRIKLKAGAPSAPLIHLKSRGKPPERPRGVGYDSEASDREEDPTLSEAIILRMQPGEDCELVRQAISSNNFGSRQKGGVDVRLRFLRSDGRRAILTVQGRHYAAILVDLPCVIEAMKSWFPKTGWMKSADVCQMLLVLGRIDREEEAVNYPLPGLAKGELDEKTWQWAHGLTPPMRWVRKRRFRKRISVRTVMEVEAEVEALLRADEEARGESKFELIDERRLEQEANAQGGEELYGDGDDDAEGEEDQGDLIETVEGQEEEDEEAAAARLAAEMEAGMMGDDEPAPAGDGALTSTGPSFESQQATQETGLASTPATPQESFSAAPTPYNAASPDAAATADMQTSSAAESSESDEDEEEQDETEREKQQDLQRQREEIADLEAAIRQEQSKVAAVGNVLLKRRLMDKIKLLQADLEVKRAGLGEGEDQDE